MGVIIRPFCWGEWPNHHFGWGGRDQSTIWGGGGQSAILNVGAWPIRQFGFGGVANLTFLIYLFFCFVCVAGVANPPSWRLWAWPNCHFVCGGRGQFTILNAGGVTNLPFYCGLPAILRLMGVAKLPFCVWWAWPTRHLVFPLKSSFFHPKSAGFSPSPRKKTEGREPEMRKNVWKLILKIIKNYFWIIF